MSEDNNGDGGDPDDCGNHPAGPPKNLFEIIRDADGFDMIVAAIDRLGIADVLRSGTHLTIFLPNDAALQAYFDQEGRPLTSVSDAELEELFEYHVLPSIQTVLSLNQVDYLDSLLGSRLDFARLFNGLTYVNDVPIDEDYSDIIASNGVIHMIPHVISNMPKGSAMDVLRDDGRFGMLISLIENNLRSSDFETFPNGGVPLTLFAPTDDAINAAVSNGLVDPLDADAVRDLVFYHIVPNRVVHMPEFFQIHMLIPASGSPLNIAASQVAYVQGVGLHEQALNSHEGLLYPIEEILVPSP